MYELVKEVGIIMFGQIATLGAATYLFKALLNQQLKKDMESYKSELQKDVENYKSELKREDEEAGTRFSRLHAERAELLKTMYANLVRLDRAAFIAAYGPVTSEDGRSSRMPTEFGQKLDAVEEDFAVTKLLLPLPLCHRIQTFLNDLWQHDVESRTGAGLPMSEIDRKQRIYENLKRSHKEKLRPLLTEIESEFRKLLE
jgi:hypothetical protein